MNPQHTVPTVKDGNFVLNESRPAAAYFVAKYGKNDKLYPKDPKVRVIVDQRMYFDMGTFYKAFGDCVVILILSALPICVSTANVTVNATCKCYSECPHLTPTANDQHKHPQ
jgi:glutathione S-transferase